MTTGFHKHAGRAPVFFYLALAILLFAIGSMTFAETAFGARYSRPERMTSTYTDPRNDRDIAPRTDRISDIRDDYVPAKACTKTTISLYNLGLLQLAAHDFFNVDRQAEVDSENGKLDLSTLLDYGYDNIAIGGEDRNRENIILFSVAKRYGEIYLYYIDRGYSEEKARKKIVKLFHRELEDVYEELFREEFPEPTPGEATMTENLALRTIHDLLPGEVRTVQNGLRPTMTIDHRNVGKELTKNELKAKSAHLDGKFDPAFLNVTIIIPPNIVFTIDLLERDSSFADQFNTDHSFEYFLSELADGRYNKNDKVMYHIRNLFAKGLHLE